MTLVLQRQELSIREINFSQHSFEGITKFFIQPTDNKLQIINVKCSGPQINKITINNINSKNESLIANFHRTSEKIITVIIPNDLSININRFECFFMEVHFTSTGNNCDLQFVFPSVDTVSGYMYCAPNNNESGSVFPCLEENSACKWLIEIVVPREEMVAICSGFSVSQQSDIHIFEISRPTTAGKVAFAVGQFEYFSDPINPKFEIYFPSHLADYIESSVGAIGQSVAFFERKFGFEFPFHYHQSVFVEYLLEEHHTAYSMTLFPINLLHNNRIVEQIYRTPRVLSAALCEQFIGVFIEPKQSADNWIGWGLAEHLASEFMREMFADERQDESVYEIKEKNDQLIQWEQENGGIVLCESISDDRENKFNVMSLRYKRFYRIKSHLVVRSWVLSISLRAICELFQYYLKREKFFDYSIIEKISVGRWNNLLESQIRKRGHISITAKPHYHKKERFIELVVGQSHSPSSFIYSGPIDISIQEPDGLFNRVVIIKPEKVNHIKILMCSKSAHLKTGQKLITRRREEIDGPILGWVQLDPEMRLVGNIKINLDEEKLILMAKNESSFWSKFCALNSLDKIQSDQNFSWILELINKRRTPVRLRLEAIKKIERALLEKDSDFPNDSLKTSLLTLYFDKGESSTFLKENCWKNIGDYLVHLALITSVSNTYIPDSQEKWNELLLLFLDMINADGHFTSWSVSHFHSTVISAIANTFSSISRSLIREENYFMLNSLLKKQLNEDLMLPSHNYCITNAVLQTFAKMNLCGVMSIAVSDYLSYDFDDNECVRLAGISALLTIINDSEKAEEPLIEIINFINKSEVPVSIRTKAVDLISDKLISLKSLRNCNLMENLYLIFNKHLDKILKLSEVGNPACLRASITDLLDIVQKLRTMPLVNIDNQYIIDSLDKPLLNEEHKQFVEQSFITGDFNLSDDSD